MWKTILQPARLFLLLAISSSSLLLHGQTTISSEKDITRPEIARMFNAPASVASFTATRFNGYNEIQWASFGEKDTRKFIVEYSSNGVYYQSAGEALVAANHTYLVKHPTFEMMPLLYRLRIELVDGRFYYSQNILLEGADVSPVKIYPTIITGNTVNVRTYFPVERVTVISGSGQQVFAKDLNGQGEDLAIVIPSLGKGMYWMHFSGPGWRSTGKFVVQ